MKKSKLLEILKLRERICDLRSITSIKEGDRRMFTPLSILLPSVSGFEDEIKELHKIVEESEEEIKKISDKLSKRKCNHELRMEYSSCFSKNNRCLLCGKHFYGDNCFEDTIYNSVNRNRGAVFFHEYYYDEDNPVYLITERKAIEIIKEVIKDYKDDEDLDLISIFSKLEMDDVRVDTREKVDERYMLIIEGKNKVKFDNGLTLVSEEDTPSIYQEFLGIPNLFVEVFMNNPKCSYEHIESGRIIHYETMKELLELIGKEKNVPFDMVIDLSRLFEVNIKDGVLDKKQVLLDLKSMLKTREYVRCESIPERINGFTEEILIKTLK